MFALFLFLVSGCDVRPDVVGLDGKAVDLLSLPADTARVVIFVRTDCPIANRYVPVINRLVAEFEPRGVSFALVYPSRLERSAGIQQHLSDYSLELSAYRDPTHRFAAFTGATITPEAVVFDRDSRMIYRGRIDDQFVDFGKSRPAPTKHDLKQVLTQLAAGERVSYSNTTAVGCYIETNTPAE